MKNFRVAWSGLLAAAAVAAISAAAGERIATGPSVAGMRDVEKIGPGLFRVGKIVTELTSQTLRIPARVNMQQGLIELVACSSGGKLHESLFEADCEPVHLQTALLLLGLNHKGGVRFQGDASDPRGDKVLIWVERNGERRRVEEYIWDEPRKTTMERTPWVFTGSKFVEDPTTGRQEFGAQVTRTLITTYRDPYTILDNPLPSGADDTVYYVNPKTTPAVGTSVTLVIRPEKAVKVKGEEK